LLATVDDAACKVVNIVVFDETVSLSCIVLVVAVAAVPAVVASVMETQTKRVHTMPLQQDWSVLVADRNSCLQSIDLLYKKETMHMSI
jgi:hypothetical protein